MVFLVFRDEMTTNQSCEPSYPHFGSFTTSHGWETQFIASWLLILASQLWKSLNYSPFCQLMTSVLLEYIMVYHLLSGQIIKNHYPEWFGYIEIIPITTHDSSEFTVRSLSFTQISKKTEPSYSYFMWVYQLKMPGSRTSKFTNGYSLVCPKNRVPILNPLTQHQFHQNKCDFWAHHPTYFQTHNNMSSSHAQVIFH